MARNGSKKMQFLAALMTARTIKAASQASGVGLRTAFRWLRDPAFKAELTQKQDSELGQVTRLTVAAMTDAVETLRSIMADDSTPATARVAAARAILESCVRFAELIDLTERVAALEAREAANEHGSEN